MFTLDTQTITVAQTFASTVGLNEVKRTIRGSDLDKSCLNIKSDFVGFWDSELGAVPPELITYVKII